MSNSLPVVAAVLVAGVITYFVRRKPDDRLADTAMMKTLWDGGKGLFAIIIYLIFAGLIGYPIFMWIRQWVRTTLDMKQEVYSPLTSLITFGLVIMIIGLVKMIVESTKNTKKGN